MSVRNENKNSFSFADSDTKLIEMIKTSPITSEKECDIC
jgi:hypothetical protein